MLLCCSECDTCNTFSTSPCDPIRVQPDLAFHPQRALYLAPCHSTLSYFGQPFLLDAKYSLPFMVPTGLYSSTFSMPSCSPSPNALRPLLRDASVVVKMAFETWSSLGSNIIGLRVLFSTTREVHICFREA